VHGSSLCILLSYFCCVLILSSLLDLIHATKLFVALAVHMLAYVWLVQTKNTNATRSRGFCPL